MDKISSAANDAQYLVLQCGYSWKDSIEVSAKKYGVSIEDIHRHFEFLKKEQERQQLADIQRAADYARDLSVNDGYSWGLAIKIAADEFDVRISDISKEFTARRAARAAKKKVNQWWK
jgi:hypothetical protein